MIVQNFRLYVDSLVVFFIFGQRLYVDLHDNCPHPHTYNLNFCTLGGADKKLDSLGLRKETR